MMKKTVLPLWGYAIAVVMLLFVSLQTVAKFTYISERGFYDGSHLPDAFFCSLAFIIIALLLSCRLVFIKKWLGVILIFLSLLCSVPAVRGIVKQKNGSLLIELLPSLFRNNSHDLKVYLEKYGEFPKGMIEFLAGKGDAVIKYRLTGGTGVTNIVQEFDGSGGWVYNPAQGIFGLNVKGMEQYTTNLTSYLEEVQKKTEKGALEE